MESRSELNHPWLVAVWPGMGNVAINAGVYLMSKLGMHLESELEARELFEMGHVDVVKGIIRTGRLPRSRFFLWKDPEKKRDLLLFLGEAQPPTGIYAYCRRIIHHSKELGVERVFTFAAMATSMRHEDESRVFAAATDATSLDECKSLKLEILDGGQISGLNGVLLGVAAERGLAGTCLLGEMPHVFMQMPYPKASLAVLRTFRTMAGASVDLADLERETEAVDAQLQTLMERIEDAIRAQQGGTPPVVEPADEKEEPPRLDPQSRQQIEELFERAGKDRSQAYQLKRELDRLKVFDEYEDRFLDLFKNNRGDEQGEGSA